MNNIGILLCGNNQTDGIAKVALAQLATSINSFSNRAVRFLNEENSEDLLSFGPFCARVLLENACSALVGRLDPFRMLYLSEFQNQAEYEHGKRAKSAFSWSGDVMPMDEKQVLWNMDNDVSKISRALFSRHLDHVYWNPAVENLIDFASSIEVDPTLADILALNSETYISETKGKSLQLYSTLSKAVHWEFFTSALLFDEITVKTAIRDTCLLVSTLGLVSHFIPTAYASISPIEAVNTYISIRRNVQ